MKMTFIWFLVSNLLGVVISNYGVSASGGVFHVHHKFAAQQRSPSTMKDHDLHRRQRYLYSIDIPLGGDGKPTGTGLYFTKLKIGSPSTDFYVNVDTGSDLFWVNCIQCSQCPKKSGLGVDLTLYDPSKSSTSQIINCDTDFCTSVSGGFVLGCSPGLQCVYQSSYGDASTSSGYFVKDVVQYDHVSGNRQTTPANSSIVIGCGIQQTGRLLDSDSALDGILGFGQADYSFLSQIAASTSIKKMFAHCLDGKNGGGIFAMGNIVEPKVNTTSLLADKTHYNVNMEGILVGEEPLPFPNSVIGTSSVKETVIDSGTTLAYVPDDMFTPLVKKIMENHSDLNVKTVDDTFQCIEYTSTSLDTDFPKITLSFEGSLQLVVYPHDYLLPYEGDYCIGWQSSATLSGLQDLILLGDMVLSDKVVLYDVENMAIGWTEYDCSTTIKVQDEQSNAIYDVQAHDLSSAHTSKTPGALQYSGFSMPYSILLFVVLIKLANIYDL